MAIDFGRKRTGIAVTDPMRIVATGLGTVATSDVPAFIAAYIAREGLDAIVVGAPTDMMGRPSDSTRFIDPALGRLRAAIPPDLPVIRYDERFTSVLAHRAMIDSGMTRSQRRDKPAVDTMAAAIILNDYIQSRAYQLDPPPAR